MRRNMGRQGSEGGRDRTHHHLGIEWRDVAVAADDETSTSTSAADNSGLGLFACTASVGRGVRCTNACGVRHINTNTNANASTDTQRSS